jgi:hypothetical protein
MRECELRTEEFWSHIASNHELLAAISSADDKPYGDALTCLQRVHSNLYLVTGRKPAGRELIITAEGNTSLFSLVDEIVAAAPRIPGWTIRALKPRCGIPEFARWNQVRIPIAEVFFEPLDLTGGGLGIRLLISDYVESTAADAKLALIQAMEFALGERAFAAEIQYIELARKDPSTESYIPLVQLEEYISWRNKRLRKD